jgi:5-methylcytosine-specific restriction endonuclease McrA
LPDKECHNVDATGNWSRAKPGEQYNTIEYHEKPSDRQPAHFIGFIEDPAMKPVSTRIAFRIVSVGELDRWEFPRRSIKQFPAYCKACDKESVVDAWLEGGTIQASFHCCKIKRAISMDRYGVRFGVERKTARRSADRVSPERRFLVLCRDRFACAYCGRSANPKALSQLFSDSTAQSETRELVVPANRLQFELGDDKTIRTKQPFQHRTIAEVMSEMLPSSLELELEVDHLIPDEVRESIKTIITGKAYEKAKSEWLVATCLECNRGKSDHLLDSKLALALFAKHIYSPEWSDAQKSEELSLFHDTLLVAIEHCRSRGVAEQT